MFNCWGISSLNSSTCGSHGVCIAPDRCNCSDSYWGDECQYPKCFSIQSNETSVCSQHGVCTRPNHCECMKLYSGEKCDTPTYCNAIPFTNGSVCNSRGNCTGDNFCNCSLGYTGQFCQHSICFNISSNSSNVCSSQGNCTGVDYCECSLGYSGSKCSIVRKCNNIVFYNSTVCNGRGTCGSENNCTCKTGFTGADCEQYHCFSHVSTSLEVCSSHGICDAPDHCICNMSYTGDNCRQPICFSIPSGNNSVCSGKGNCTKPDICNCTLGYSNSNCDTPICFGKRADDSSVCNAVGNCTLPNTCVCPLTHIGIECEIPKCFGIAANDSQVCNGNGTCIQPDDCQCHTGYLGSVCDDFKCFGLNYTDHSVCSSHGGCSSPDNCTCNHGYSGSDCDIFSCFGVMFNDSSVCSGHGICSGSDKCVCSIQKTGSDCNTMVCTIDYPENRDVCIGKEICSNTQCSCDSKYITWSNGTCEPYISSVFSLKEGVLTGEFGNEYISTIAGENRTINCTELFHPDTMILLGNPVLCRWISNGSLSFEIVLSSDASLAYLGDDILKVNLNWPNTKIPHYIIVKINQTVPVVVILTGPTTINTCDNLTIDGSNSSGNNIHYSWSVTKGHNLDSLNSKLKVLDQPTVHFGANDLTPGTYSFSLTVTSASNNESSTSSIEVLKLESATPLVSIRGPTIQRAFSRELFQLEGKAIHQCSFDNDITFSWVQIKGASVAPVHNGRFLTFKPGTFPSAEEKKEYVFELIGSSMNDSTSKDNVTVVVTPSSLICNIDVFDELSSLYDFVLNGSKSYDPDYSDTTEQFLWLCMYENGTSCLLPPSLNVNTPIVTIPQGNLSTGKYKFKLVYSKGNRNSTCFHTIKITATTQIQVKIEAPLTVLVQKECTLSSVIDPPNDQYEYRWSVVHSTIPLVLGQTIKTSTDRSSLTFNSNVLVPGKQYSLQVSVYLENNKLGSAIKTITTATVPVVTSLEVEPNHGVAFIDTFVLYCIWNGTENQQFHSYQFGYIDETTGLYVPLNVLSIVENKFTTPYLPVGVGVNNTLLLVADVTNSIGSTIRVQKRVFVTAPNNINLVQNEFIQVTKNIVFNDVEMPLNLAMVSPDFLLNNSDSSNATTVREQLLELVETLELTPSIQVYQLQSAACSRLTNNPYQMSNVSRISALNIAQKVVSIDDKYYSQITLGHIGNCVSNVIRSLEIATGDTSVFNNYTHIRSVYSQSIEIIDKIANNLLQNSFVGSYPVSVNTDTFSVAIVLEESQRLYKHILPIKVPNSNTNSIVRLPSSQFVGEAKDNIGVKMILLPVPEFDLRSNENRTSPIFSLTFLHGNDEYSVSELIEPIIFSLPASVLNRPGLNLNESEYGYRPICKYWDTVYNRWNTSGCYLTNVTESFVYCACNHTTEFSVFFEYAVPKFQFLTVDDFRNISKLNKDNMTTVITMSALFGIYLVCILCFIVLDLFRLKFKLKKMKNQMQYKGTFRWLLRRYKITHPYISVIYQDPENVHYNKYMKLTILYIGTLGIMTGNAVTFGTEPGNALQWLVSSVVSCMAQAPFVIFFSVLFISTAPVNWSNFIVSCCNRKKKTRTDFTGVDTFTDPDDEGFYQSTDYPKQSKYYARTSVTEVESVQSQAEGDLNWLQRIQRALHHYSSKIYDFGDMMLDWVNDKSQKFFNVISWHGIFLLIPLSALYVAAVIGGLFILRLNFSWFTLDYMIGGGILALVVYVFYIIFQYTRLRFMRFKKGQIKLWKLHYLALILIAVLINIVSIMAVALIPTIVVYTPYGHPWFIRMILIEGALTALAIGGCLWFSIMCIPMQYVKNPDNPQSQEFSNIVTTLPLKHHNNWTTTQTGSDLSSGSLPSTTFDDKSQVSTASNKKSIAMYLSLWLRSKYWFPWWFSPFNYTLALLYIGGCSYILVLYGIKFDSNKQAPGWLIGCGTGIAQDIFIKGPLEFFIKYILIAALLKFIEGIFFEKIKIVNNDR
jgi:hypothetical protein